MTVVRGLVFMAFAILVRGLAGRPKQLAGVRLINCVMYNMLLETSRLPEPSLTHIERCWEIFYAVERQH